MTAAQRPAAAEPRPQPGATARPARPAPAPAPVRRPPLRIVGPRELGPRARRRRARTLTAGVGALISALLFGLVTFHVLIAQGQLQLGRLETRAMDSQARYDRLRLQVAQLSSPGRIVAAAQERLGMVPPPGITYLSPGGSGNAVAKPVSPPTTAPAAAGAPAPGAPGATTPTTAPRSTTPTTASRTTPTTTAPRTTPTTAPRTTPTTAPRSTTPTTAAPHPRPRP